MSAGRGLAWLVAVSLSTGACAHVQPSPEQLAAQQAIELAAKTRAEAEAEAARRRELQRIGDQRRRWTQEWEALQARHAVVLAALQRWDAAGDERTEVIEAVLQLAGHLGDLAELVEACGARIGALADKPVVPPDTPELAGKVRLGCSLALRARAIIQRQVLAQAKVFLGVPPWAPDVPARYRQTGWVSWHQLSELLELEQSYVRRVGPWQRAADAVGAALSPALLLGPGLRARAELLGALARGEAFLGWPVSIQDRQAAALVRSRWHSSAAQGPMAGRRAGLVEVRALDGTWQTLSDEASRASRQQLDVTALFVSGLVTPPLDGCWLIKGTLDRVKSRVTLRWGDDLRKVRCPGRPPQPSEVAQAPGATRTRQ